MVTKAFFESERCQEHRYKTPDYKYKLPIFCGIRIHKKLDNIALNV